MSTQQTNMDPAGCVQPAPPAPLLPIHFEPRLASVDRWLSARRRAVVWAIVLFSVFVRVLYFGQVQAGPLSHYLPWDQYDGFFFHELAVEITSGDPLLDGAFHPRHALWKQRLAQSYFTRFPDQAEVYARQAHELGDGASAAYLLWSGWLGGKAYYQEPLYPYSLALLYTTLGPDPIWMLVIQLVAGVLTNLLIYLVARRYAGDLCAVLSASMAGFYGPMLFYEMTLLRTSLLVFAGIGLIWVVQRALDHGQPRRWAVAGACFGLALLLKTIYAVLLAGVVIWLGWTHRSNWRELVRSAGVLLCAVSILIAPLVIRNLSVGVAPLAFSSVGSLGIIISNAKGDEPVRGSRAYAYDDFPEIMHEDPGGMVTTLIAAARTHDSSGAFVRRLLLKFMNLWHWYEVPNNLNFYYFREHAPALGQMLVSFLVVGPLGVLGFLLMSRRPGRSWPLLVSVVTTIATVVLFGNCSRYRIVMVPALMVMGGYALGEMLSWLARGHWRRLALGSSFLLLLLAHVAQPLPPEAVSIRITDYNVPNLYYYQPLTRRATEVGDEARALELLRANFAMRPGYVDQLASTESRGGVPLNQHQLTIVHFYAQVAAQLASHLERAGYASESAVLRQRVTAMREFVRAGRHELQPSAESEPIGVVRIPPASDSPSLAGAGHRRAPMR